MSDRCFSTLICAKADAEIFQQMGYRADQSEALSVDGNEIRDAHVMTDEEAAGGHYSELTALKGLPFLVSNTGCQGAFGDHLLASDGEQWAYVESLHESNYPAVRVNPNGTIADEELEDAREYWHVYSSALRAFKRRAAPSGDTR